MATSQVPCWRVSSDAWTPLTSCSLRLRNGTVLSGQEAEQLSGQDWEWDGRHLPHLGWHAGMVVRIRVRVRAVCKQLSWLLPCPLSQSQSGCSPTSRLGEWSYPFATGQNVANGWSRNVITDTESASHMCIQSAVATKPTCKTSYANPSLSTHCVGKGYEINRNV